ncbi:MAG: arylesterase [Clostridia bacterium]|nr:arylesterase [Clostridia bacterium]
MRSLLAFGDSNTWGLIPGTYPHQRFSWETRWTGLLQNKLPDVRVIEEGLCGRTTVFEDSLRPNRRGIDSLPEILESNDPIDSAIVMLGTNDCKTIYGVSAHTIGKGIELLLGQLTKHVEPDKILLISPIHLGDEVWREDKDPEFDTKSVEVSKKLKDVYSQISLKWGTKFLAASDYVKASSIDEEHLNEEGHEIFSEVVYEKLINEVL